MELTKQVCSLDLAQRLKELGVKQESHFYWCRLGAGDCITENVNLKTKVHDKHWHAAFTVAELGEMLPAEFPGDSDSDLVTFKGEANDFVKWFVRYENDAQKIVSHGEVSETEADARAKMLIYLIENNLLTV